MERGPQMANRIEGKAVDKTSIKHFVKLIRAAKPRFLYHWDSSRNRWNTNSITSPQNGSTTC